MDIEKEFKLLVLNGIFILFCLLIANLPNLPKSVSSQMDDWERKRKNFERELVR